MPVAENFQRGALGLVIVVGDLVEILAEDGVRPDRKRLPRRHFHLDVFIERRARQFR